MEVDNVRGGTHAPLTLTANISDAGVHAEPSSPPPNFHKVGIDPIPHGEADFVSDGTHSGSEPSERNDIFNPDFNEQPNVEFDNELDGWDEFERARSDSPSSASNSVSEQAIVENDQNSISRIYHKKLTGK